MTPEDEALTALAETLDAARDAANAVEVTAPQTDAYGHIAEALVLTELEGLPQRELAQRLGLSPSGARTRVQRGRRLLKELIDDCCKLEVDARGNVLDAELRARPLLGGGSSS